MATIAAIAFKRGTATERLIKSANILADDFGLARIVLPKQGHDAALIHAQQIDTVADFFEQLVFALSATSTPQETVTEAEPEAPDKTDYNGLSHADLDALIQEREIVLPEKGSGAQGGIVKADKVAALEAWDAEHAETGDDGDADATPD